MAQHALTAGKGSLSLRVLARQTASYVPAMLLPAVIGLLSSAVFTRIFSAAGYGQYSLTMSIATLATAISAQWLQQAVNRYLPGTQVAEGKVEIKRTLVAGLAVVEIAVLLTGMAACLMLREYTFTVPAVGFVALSVLYGPVGVVLQAEMRGRRYSVFHVLNSVLKFSLSFVLVLLVPLHPSLLIWGGVLSLAVLTPALWRSAGLPSPREGIALVDPGTRVLLRKFATYGLPMAGWFLASSLLGVGDRYVIQWFRGSAEVGIYSASYQLISGAIGLVTSPVILAAHPFLMRAWGEGDAERTARWLGTILELLLIVGMVAVGLTALFSVDLARWFLGPEFRSGHVVMPVALGGLVLWNGAMYLHKPLEFAERTRMMLGLGLGSAVLNVVLNVLFVPHYGYIAAAWTTLASYAAYAVTAGVAGRQVVRWNVRRSLLLWVALWILALLLVGAWAREIGTVAVGYWGGVACAAGVVALAGTVLVGLLWRPLLQPLVHARRGQQGPAMRNR